MKIQQAYIDKYSVTLVDLSQKQKDILLNAYRAGTGKLETITIPGISSEIAKSFVVSRLAIDGDTARFTLTQAGVYDATGKYVGPRDENRVSLD